MRRNGGFSMRESEMTGGWKEEEPATTAVENEIGNQGQEPDGRNRESGRKKGSFFKELIVYAVIIVLCVTVVPRYVVQRTQVSGISMLKTLEDEESLLVEKVSYYFNDPSRFDIITFYPKGREHDEYYIKRVIGLPGETIQITGNTIYINGRVLEEHYGREAMQSGGIAEEPIKLGKNEFFVLGDNRNDSIDSRDEEVGIVKKDNIDGHAILRIYPFSKFGTIQNKNS